MPTNPTQSLTTPAPAARHGRDEGRDKGRVAGRGIALIGLLAVALPVMLGACTTRIETSGNELRNKHISEVQSGPYTRNQVFDNLGSPSFAGTFDNSTWHYLFERRETFAFFEPELRERTIVTVRFNEKDEVVGVEVKGMELARNVDPNENKTPTAGNKLNFIEQMIANLGRFNNAGEQAP